MLLKVRLKLWAIKIKAYQIRLIID